MKKIFLLLGCLVLSTNLLAAETLFQVGNASALFSGAIEGDMTLKELKHQGNFGLGTFNDIQGEMIVLDGNFYQIMKNGETRKVDLTWKTPFAEVVNFYPDVVFQSRNRGDYESIKTQIYSKLTNKNVPYAMQMKGQFIYLKLRSRSPRKPLQTNNSNEVVYTLKNVSGTLVGFWFPDYLLNLSVPGFHFHFISKDKQVSGHVLNLALVKGTISLMRINKIELTFPHTSIYKQAKIIPVTMATYQQAQMETE